MLDKMTRSDRDEQFVIYLFEIKKIVESFKQYFIVHTSN